MKNSFLFISAISALALSISSCNKSTEDEFNAANGPVSEKYIKRLEIITNNISDNRTFIVNYDGNNRVSSVTDGSSSYLLSYNSFGELNTVTDDGELYNVNDLYQSPYDAFENGNVLEYDKNGNPFRVEVYEDGYNSDLFIGEIFYDPNPNPFFYTLKAARIIDVLDRVNLNFGPQSPSIIKARLLLPYNNIRGMIFKDITGTTQFEVHIETTYDTEMYPSRATVTVLSPDETDVYLVKFYYK